MTATVTDPAVAVHADRILAAHRRAGVLLAEDVRSARMLARAMKRVPVDLHRAVYARLAEDVRQGADRP